MQQAKGYIVGSSPIVRAVTGFHGLHVVVAKNSQAVLDQPCTFKPKSSERSATVSNRGLSWAYLEHSLHVRLLLWLI
jgi:hypothetical protein